MLDQFLDFFRQPSLPGTSRKFAVAVSGGVDSMVLSELCHQAKLDFFLAHCNFQLREAESERDEKFVRAWGERNNVPVQVRRFDTRSYAQENGLSIQEAARELRYLWFRQMKNEGTCDYTLLAHQANDALETVLINFFRGTGLQGLTGMPDRSTFFLRPLLKFTRQQILDFAERNSIKWVEDSSNLTNKYTRNYFRNELLPALRKVFPQVEENLLNNIDRFQKTDELYIALVKEFIRKISRPIPGGAKIPILILKKWAQTSLIYEIIKKYGFTEKQVPEVLKLLESASGKYLANQTFRIIKHRNHLIFTENSTEEVSFLSIEEKDRKLIVDHQFALEIEKFKNRGHSPATDSSRAQVDAGKIEFPLLLRKWKQGDYFYPLGMDKKKKLSRFFIDQKLSLQEKEQVWVLESAGKIVWVVGHRIDNRFKIGPSTAEIISFSVSSL